MPLRMVLLIHFESVQLIQFTLTLFNNGHCHKLFRNIYISLIDCKLINV